MTSPPVPGSGVTISPEQMYAEVRGLHDTVIRMDGKLDALGQQKTIVDDHETRLRHLEERRLPHSVISIVAAAGATVALVWQAVSR